MVQDSELGLQAMIDRGPEWLDGYLRQFEQGEPIAENSMIGILDGAASMAHFHSSRDWAGIAIRAAELMARAEKDRDFALQRAMEIRASFIAKLGSREGDPVLDSNIIVRWFKAETRVSIEVAEERSVAWRNSPLPAQERLPLNQLRELRAIRHRVKVLRIVSEGDALPDDPMLTKWLRIGNLLP